MMTATYFGKHVSEKFIFIQIELINSFLIFPSNQSFNFLAPNMVKRIDWTKTDFPTDDFYLRRFSTKIIIASTGEEDCYDKVR